MGGEGFVVGFVVEGYAVGGCGCMGLFGHFGVVDVDR